MYNLIVILGPTASGKTKLAVHLADKLSTEILSADSRQIYRGMNLGTGKDLEEYRIENRQVPYHLIDIKEAGESYNVYDFQLDFSKAFQAVTSKNKIPILAGGSGLYIDAVLKNYQYTSVPIDLVLRDRLSSHSLSELEAIFRSIPSEYTDKADLSTYKRAIRSIEISTFLQSNYMNINTFNLIQPLVFGLNPELIFRREKITKRLHERLEEGLVEEVKFLLDSGVSSDKLVFYGLEYKFIAEYLTQKSDYKSMVEKLNSAIHQFAKRQMTYFRKMERDGTIIHWLDPAVGEEENSKEMVKKVWNQ